MKTKIIPVLSLLLGLLCASCAREVMVPADFSDAEEPVKIYPDYRDITVPPNIAPLNVMVQTEAAEYVMSIEGVEGSSLVAGAEADGKVSFEPGAWRDLLEQNRGKELRFSVYAQGKDNRWQRYPAYSIRVAEEPIDSFLSYRLLEPSYELYRQLGLYQRNLTNFDVTTIYENNRQFEDDNNHCVNCHNYQAYSTENMLFHVRAKHGGTVFVHDGKARKVNLKTDSILSGCVYPTWHPEKPWVVFSSNKTGQVFHMTDHQKVEVVDYGSDLVFYDVEKNELSNILRTGDTMETFPCWSPDGRKLFYCSATTPQFAGVADSVATNLIIHLYDSVRYNLMSMDFDPATRMFSTPKVEMDCAARGMSASVPRVSPDGRYVLFTLGSFGQFHIWHKSSDLYVKDLQTDSIYRLDRTNSDDVDSYHSWSSNGRWMVFSSRRDDGSYTRPYIAYFDKQGRGQKAFLLPQEDPEENLLLTKSYNVPELTRDAVRTTKEQLREVIYADDKAEKVVYK